MTHILSYAELFDYCADLEESNIKLQQDLVPLMDATTRMLLRQQQVKHLAAKVWGSTKAEYHDNVDNLVRYICNNF